MRVLLLSHCACRPGFRRISLRSGARLAGAAGGPLARALRRSRRRFPQHRFRLPVARRPKVKPPARSRQAGPEPLKIQLTPTMKALASFTLALLLLANAALAAEPFRAGAATSNITPRARLEDRRRVRALSRDRSARRTARALPGARRRQDEAGARRLRSARHAPQRERRGAAADRGGDGHSAGARADLRHAHALRGERAGGESLHLRAGARRLPALRRAADRRRRAARDQQPAAGGDRLRHGGGAGARLQSPLVHARRDDAGESVRQDATR